MALTDQEFQAFLTGKPVLDWENEKCVFDSICGNCISVRYNNMVVSYLIDMIKRDFIFVTSLPLLSCFSLIRDWADDKGLLDPSRVDKQMLKLGEEYGEVCKEVLHDNPEKALMEIGDVVVVCTILAAQMGSTIEECIQKAYAKISSRTGKTVSGVFVKDEE